MPMAQTTNNKKFQVPNSATGMPSANALFQYSIIPSFQYIARGKF